MRKEKWMQGTQFYFCSCLQVIEAGGKKASIGLTIILYNQERIVVPMAAWEILGLQLCDLCFTVSRIFRYGNVKGI